MTFISTKKYPKNSEFGDFINENGGYTNASTTMENTIFTFEIGNEAFDEALDRFIHFFIDPTLDDEATEKEINQVNP